MQDDWRSKPRTGRSQFNPLLPEIADRRQRGETLRQMHEDLTKQGRFTLGYDQFIKYVRKAFTEQTREATRVAVAVTDVPRTGAHPFAGMATGAEVRRDSDSSLHPSVPDKDKIYGRPQD